MLVTLKEILAEGKKRKIAIGSFNTPNSESLIAVLEAAEELNLPVIIAHAQCHEYAAPLDRVGPMMVALAKTAKVPVCVHLDHGEEYEYCKKSIELGFTSVMIDKSALPYEENLAESKKMVEYAHAHGASVEAELGCLPARENGGSNGSISAADMYTNPALVKRFTEETGVDALAIAFGTAHGIYQGKPVLNMDVITNVKKET
ncbi:MAG: class II fructose-bisphosphate aldolase, partial [Clostridia bacterium]|nr:class II fructose-bisphosphate aldolase [Clostridia bacterium]